MKILHGLVQNKNVGTIVPLGNGMYENGEWNISEATAKALKADGAIMLHKNQEAASRHGGIVTDYRSRIAKRPNGDDYTLYTITYRFNGKYMNVKYLGGWSQQMALEDV